MKEQQLLRDPNIEPTQEAIAAGLGAANNSYILFLEGLKQHDIQVNWRYYTDGKSWLGKGLYRWETLRGTKKEVTTFWFSIWDGFFKVTIYIPEKARADALNLALGDEVRKMIENAKQMGKLKFFPLVFDLHSSELFGEIYTLIDFRKSIKWAAV